MAGKKRYYTSVYVGMENGKQKHVSVSANSKRELNEKKQKILREVENGKDVNRAVFGTWAKAWLDKKRNSGIGQGTITEYENLVKHLNKRFENVEFKKIRLQDFDKLIYELARENPNTGKPMAKKTLEALKKVARSIFKYANANGVAGVTDFFDAVDIPRGAPEEKRRALTENEIDMIVNTPHRAQLPSMIMLFAGLRRGEALALKWSDIDLSNGIISVNSSVVFDGNTPVIKEGGKTENARRLVPMPPILIQYLKSYKESEKVLSPYVCTSSSGKLITKSSWRKLWESYLMELNLKYGYHDRINKFNPTKKTTTLPPKIDYFTAHCLRHTFATMLFLEGVPVEKAKQFMGHGDIAVTSNIYTDYRQSNLAISPEYENKLQTEYKVVG